MKIESTLSDAAVLKELAERLTEVRLQQNISQADLAERSGVSLQSIKRMESGLVAPRLDTLIAACRALGLLDRFDLLVPAPSLRPMDLLKLQGRKRKRARKSAPKEATPWIWGEEK